MSTGKATRRIGLREARNLQRAVVAVVILLLFLALQPYYINLINIRNFQTCQSNVQKIAKGISIYRQDFDDTLPLAANWTDLIRPNIAETSNSGMKVEAYMKCPLDTTGGNCSYVFNKQVEGLSLTTEPREPEVLARRNSVGRLERTPILLEKHGSNQNAVVEIKNWAELKSAVSLPHIMPSPNGPRPTGVIATVGGGATTVTTELMESKQNKKF
jgi:hypothetical protein